MNHIWIIDEQFKFREGMKNLLEIRIPNSVIETFDSLNKETLTNQNKDRLPNIVIIEPFRHNTYYLDIVERLIEYGVKVVILTMDSSHKSVLRFLRRNISGFLIKKMSTKELVAYVQVIMQGSRYIHPAAANILHEEFQKENHQRNIDLAMV